MSFASYDKVEGSSLTLARVSTGGAYDELTLWEQIDMGAQYTPAKKWLTSVPIGLCVRAWRRRWGIADDRRFLISTHYSNYDYTLFAINFTALMVVLFPKLPIVSAALGRCVAGCTRDTVTAHACRHHVNRLLYLNRHLSEHPC